MWEQTKLGCLWAIVIGAICFALSFLGAWIFQLIWNWVMPAVFSLPKLTYWQAFGIDFMANILFYHPNFRVKPGD